MVETNDEKNNNLRTTELDQSIERKMLSPVEEYQRFLRKRNRKIFLFVFLLLIELAFVIFFCRIIKDNNLYYRVTKQIENTREGKNIFETGTYIGNMDFGYFKGDGIFRFASGTVYTGQWNNDRMNGVGTLNVPNEGIYKGDFLDSKKDGQGIFTWNDGAIYDGGWKNDQMNGDGTYTSPDAVKYVGVFKENKFLEGECSFINDTGTYVVTYKDYAIDNLRVVFNDGTRYDGESDGTTLRGIGEMQFANGDMYSGKYSNGMRNGQGVYVWSNGDTYDGTWFDDAMSGSGKYTFANGSYAQGTFEENSFKNGSYIINNSFGEYTFGIKEQEFVSVNMVLTNGTKYSGDMKNGSLTGKTQITYSNGDKYSGAVVDGYKSGQGTYTWNSGASYDGEWKDDKMDGQGTYFYPSKETGYKLTGSFEKGVPNGSCRYYVTSYESYKTDWKNGKCVKVYE